MFSMSREGRSLYETLTLPLRTDCDQFALMFGESALSMQRSGLPWPKIPILKDCPKNFNFEEHEDAYRFVTEEYVVKDFARVPDLVRLAHILKSYDLRSIEGVASLCKRQGKFTIPYLAGALENEVGAKVIEGVRLEDRLSRKVMETSTPPLPSYRPSEVRDRMNDIAHERKIDDVLGGRNTK